MTPSRALLCGPRRAGEASHPAGGGEAGARVLRGRALLLPARRTSTSTHQFETRSWRRCRPRCCSLTTALSPTRSRCGWRCSRSPGSHPNPLAEGRSARGSGLTMAMTASPGARDSPAAVEIETRSRAQDDRVQPTSRWSAATVSKARSTPTHLVPRRAVLLDRLFARSARRCACSPLAKSRARSARDQASTTSCRRDFDAATRQPRPTGSWGDPRSRQDLDPRGIAWLIERASALRRDPRCQSVRQGAGQKARSSKPIMPPTAS